MPISSTTTVSRFAHVEGSLRSRFLADATTLPFDAPGEMCMARWMVCPPKLSAATPVGARRMARSPWSRSHSPISVDLPVPASPVISMPSPDLSPSTASRWNLSLPSPLVVSTMMPPSCSDLSAAWGGNG